MANDNKNLKEAEANVAELVPALKAAESKVAEQAAVLIDMSFKASKKIAELNDQIKYLQGKPASKIKGFMVLEVNDPFGMGAVRAYRSAGGKSVQADRLPFVLPIGDQASITALESYIVRANGGGDTDRVKAAQKAMQK